MVTCAVEIDGAGDGEGDCDSRGCDGCDYESDGGGGSKGAFRCS